MNHLTEDKKVSSAVTPTAGAAAQTAIEGTTLDMQGFDAFAVMLRMGAITSGAVTSMKIQQGDESNLSDAADLLGTSQTIAADDDGEIFISDIIRPAKRYVRVYVTRGTQDAVVASGEYIQYIAREKSVTQPSGTTVEAFVTPAEGTA